MKHSWMNKPALSKKQITEWRTSLFNIIFENRNNKSTDNFCGDSDRGNLIRENSIEYIINDIKNYAQRDNTENMRAHQNRLIQVLPFWTILFKVCKKNPEGVDLSKLGDNWRFSNDQFQCGYSAFKSGLNPYLEDDGLLLLNVNRLCNKNLSTSSVLKIINNLKF